MARLSLYHGIWCPSWALHVVFHWRRRANVACGLCLPLAGAGNTVEVSSRLWTNRFSYLNFQFKIFVFRSFLFGDAAAVDSAFVRMCIQSSICSSCLRFFVVCVRGCDFGLFGCIDCCDVVNARMLPASAAAWWLSIRRKSISRLSPWLRRSRND